MSTHPCPERRWRASLAALAAAVAALCLAARASADTIVYAQDGNVMIARSDGSGARLVAAHPPDGTYLHEYRWPSESDGGVIAVADVSELPTSDGPLLGGDSGGTFELFDQQGHGLRTLPGFSYVLNPWLRISPDGQHLAWGAYDGQSATYTEPTSGAAGATAAVIDHGRPVWLDDQHLMITYFSSVFRLDNEAQYAYYTPGQPGASPSGDWFSDYQVSDADPSLNREFDEFFPAISRDHQKMAIDETQDVFEVGDAPPASYQRQLRLFTVNGTPPQSLAAPTLDCTLTLPSVGDDLRRNAVSFSPDGTRIALDSDAGIEIANISDLSADANGTCLHVTPRLVLPGGHQPFWSPANLQPPPTPAPPTPNPTPPPTPNPTPTPPPCCSSHPSFTALSVAEHAFGRGRIAALPGVNHALAGAGFVFIAGHGTLKVKGNTALRGAFVCGSRPCRVTISSTLNARRGAHASANTVRSHRHPAKHGQHGHHKQRSVRLRTVHLRIGAHHAKRFAIRLSGAQQTKLHGQQGVRMTVTFTIKTARVTKRARHTFSLHLPQSRHRHRRHHRKTHHRHPSG